MNRYKGADRQALEALYNAAYREESGEQKPEYFRGGGTKKAKRVFAFQNLPWKNVGSWRYSQSNESYTAWDMTPEGRQVLILLSYFPQDDTAALAFFSSENMSELDRIESTFTYNLRPGRKWPVSEAVSAEDDIGWVMKEVDKNAASWEEDTDD